MIKEILSISKANNELLGFICKRIAPPENIEKAYLDVDVDDFMQTSLEMSEIFEKYDVMPDEFGIS